MGSSSGGDSSLPPKLNGAEKGSFINYTIRERWPKVITRLIDHINNMRQSLVEQYGEGVKEDADSVIRDLSEIRESTANDKPLRNLTDESYSYEMWNKALNDLRKKRGEEETTWCKIDFLFVECLFWRKIIGALAKTKHLRNLDIYRKQKIEGFNSHLKQIEEGIKYMLSVVEKLEEKQRRETLEDLLKLCLWGNKCDIALTDGDVPTLKHSPTEAARKLDSFILRNDLKTAIDSFFLRLRPNKKGLRELHVVLDNMGPEFMNDLVFVEYVLETKLADRTILHGKEYPYFISDVTRSDFEWALAELNRLSGVFRQFFEMLNAKVKKGELLFHDHPFWTYPHPYSEMKTVAADLYSELSEASIIIFKGDMNYQKLDANIDWSFETPFQKALNGFLPAPILALRSVKSETIAGLPKDVAARMRQKSDRHWMETGEYGVAELAFEDKQ